MEEKHLRELLKEKQEPFVLKNYINERRCELKRPVAQTQLQPKRRKPISQNPTFPSNFCKNRCLFSFFDSDLVKSPLFDFHSPPKSPCRNSNTLFVNIPSRTAALLLESALRIQKQSSSSSKPKNHNFGFLGSVLKRIALRTRNQKREIRGKESPISLKEMLKWDSLHGIPEFAGTTENSVKTVAFLDKKGTQDMDFSCSSERSDWWKGLEAKSEGLESSSSCSSNSLEVSEEMEVREDEFRSCEKGFCSSPFRFRGVEEWPEPGFRTPEFGSPAESPGRRKTKVEEEEVENQLFPSTVGAGGDKAPYEAEEENEQLSPVSILDAPFTEEDQEEEEADDGDGDGCLHEFEHSLATVQRVKHQLLSKLRRFERLAALDPLELEKRIAQDEEEEEEEDQDGDNNDRSHNSKKDERDVKSVAALDNENREEFVEKVLIPIDGHHLHLQIQSNAKRLLLDLAEEETQEGIVDREALVKRVCKKIEWWRSVESNTIDMTVESDFRRERHEWLRNPKEVQEIVIKVELVILGSLVDELLTELN